MDTSTTSHISSEFELYSNSRVYSETKLSDVLHSAFSIPLNVENLSKSTELSCMNPII